MIPPRLSTIPEDKPMRRERALSVAARIVTREVADARMFATICRNAGIFGNWPTRSSPSSKRRAPSTSAVSRNPTPKSGATQMPDDDEGCLVEPSEYDTMPPPDELVDQVAEFASGGEIAMMRRMIDLNLGDQREALRNAAEMLRYLGADLNDEDVAHSSIKFRREAIATTEAVVATVLHVAKVLAKVDGAYGMPIDLPLTTEREDIEAIAEFAAHRDVANLGDLWAAFPGMPGDMLLAGLTIALPILRARAHRVRTVGNQLSKSTRSEERRDAWRASGR
jgi:hypothetical protein